MNRRLARFGLLGAALLMLLGFGACTDVRYYGQCVGGHLSLLSKRRPISAVLEDPASPPELCDKLALVLKLRDFASQELKLPENGSYRCFADLGRPFLVWNVVAAPEFSLAPKTWCFPVAGCVSYRGYHTETEARVMADRLRQEGYDVYLYGVAAYSTLGWFDDPVLNTFLGRSELGLAALIFHEVAHQRLYVKDDSTFNESFAMLVEQEGVLRWLDRTGQAERKGAWLRGQEREERFVGLLLAARQQLKELYASGAPAEAMRAGKERIFAGLRKDYEALKAEWGGDGRFDRWFETPLNNARFVSVQTYQGWVPAFRHLLQAEGGDWESFYRAAEAIGSLPEAERQARLRQLAESGTVAGPADF